MIPLRAAAAVAMAAMIAAPEEGLAWQPKDNKCSICPSCCAPPPPPRGGDGYGAPSFPTPSRDPQRLAEMQRNEKAAEDAWNRGDIDESERRLQAALGMADEAGDRARIQGVLDRLRSFRAAERERQAREERERQRARAEADFNNKLDGILNGFQGDFDGSGAAPAPGGGQTAVGRPAPREDPVVDPRDEPPPLPREQAPPVAREPQPAPLSPDRPVSKSPHYPAPPRPMISAIPPSHETERNVEDALNKANGNPVDAQYMLAFQRLKEFPDGDPEFVQEELSYLAGLARSYVGKGGRSAISPDVDPTQKVRQQLDLARGNRDADALRHSAEIRDTWQARRNVWIASSTKASRDGSLEGAVEVLAEQYRATSNPDILNAIRYMEGGGLHAGNPRR